MSNGYPPRRIRRRRVKGWRMPEGAVYVGRPTKWGNPYTVGECGECPYGSNHEGPHVPLLIDGVLHEYRSHVFIEVEFMDSHFLDPLRGKDLACWCPLDQPCHADVLLELANA